MWGKAKAYFYGGLGLVGILTVISCALAVNAWLGERDRRVMAELNMAAETIRADNAEARHIKILEAYANADTKSAERRAAVRAVEKTGLENPPVGPRSAAMYRSLREQHQRDQQGGKR